MTEPLSGLAEHAHDTHVVVVGGGIAGLVAALECAKVGLRVTVLESSDRIGGAVRGTVLAGLALDAGAESFATRGGHVRALLDELGLGDAIVSPAPGGAWVAGLPNGGAAPLPPGGMLGIPDNPFSDDVRRIIGWRGAWRAYLDRLRPPLTIGHERSLGRLVRVRMGDAVVERLVAPVTSGVYSAHPDDIDVDVAVPGLNRALTRTGSLAGAVAQLRGERTSAPGSAVEGIEGGMSRLVDALRSRLEELGAVVRTDAAVSGIERADVGWSVELDGESLPAHAVIVATPEGAARHLLSPHVPGLAAEPARSGPEVHIVTLVLDAPLLGAHPRGTGLLTVPGARAAKALTHSTAKWPWLAREAEAQAPGRHVVRVSFGGQDAAPPTAGLDDADVAALALAEASALLGVPLEPWQLVAARLERFDQAQPASAIGQAEAAAAALAAIRTVDGLAAVGAWLSGTGLAQVVPGAIAEADRVRHAALWD